MLIHAAKSVLPAKEATMALFPQKLEFNPPVHENWNIVHIGMQIPEAHQIYICGFNCMRGVVLTAAEMGEQDRFSSVILFEEDVIDGTLWEATRDGIADVLYKLPKLPPCVIVFPVCTHHFAGVDMDSIYASLEAEFPSVAFIRGFMDPIMQKHGLPPDQRLRKVKYDPLPQCEPQSDFIIAARRRVFSRAGFRSLQTSGSERISSEAIARLSDIFGLSFAFAGGHFPLCASERQIRHFAYGQKAEASISISSDEFRLCFDCRFPSEAGSRSFGGCHGWCF